MKTFRQHLNEGRDAPLYHGTSIENSILIMNSGFLSPGEFQEHGYPFSTISATRDPRYATMHASNVARETGTSGTYFTAVFVLDQAKILQRHKILPHDDFPNSRKDGYWNHNPEDGEMVEHEEIIKADQLSLAQYCTGIWVSCSREQFVKFIENGIKGKSNSPVKTKLRSLRRYALFDQAKWLDKITYNKSPSR